MERMDFLTNPETWVETAILSKWALEEAWLSCMDVLENGYKKSRITALEKVKLDEMYTSFFQQAFYSAVKTKEDLCKLVQDTRKMLIMLKELDLDSWIRFMRDHTQADSTAI